MYCVIRPARQALSHSAARAGVAWKASSASAARTRRTARLLVDGIEILRLRQGQLDTVDGGPRRKHLVTVAREPHFWTDLARHAIGPVELGLAPAHRVPVVEPHRQDSRPVDLGPGPTGEALFPLAEVGQQQVGRIALQQ